MEFPITCITSYNKSINHSYLIKSSMSQMLRQSTWNHEPFEPMLQMNDENELLGWMYADEFESISQMKLNER